VNSTQSPTIGGFSHPEVTVQHLHISEGAHVADFGSGSGYFTLLIAPIVGDKGVVTALDVQKTALDVVTTKAKDAGIANIKTVRCNLEKAGSSTLPDSSQDMVLLANILFQSQQKEAIVAEARRVTKPEGEVVMIDWLPESPFGPQDGGWKLSKEEGRQLAERHGLTFQKEFSASINHWGMLFKKERDE